MTKKLKRKKGRVDLNTLGERKINKVHRPSGGIKQLEEEIQWEYKTTIGYQHEMLLFASPLSVFGQLVQLQAH